MEPESEQIKDVYAHFGLAFYRAQCLERSIIFLLAAALNPAYLRQRPAERDVLYADEAKKTLGALIAELKKRVMVPSGLESKLGDALRRRNWLAHDYFWERAVVFSTAQGRTVMIRELQEATDAFGALDEVLHEITMRWAGKLGLTPEKLEAQMKAMSGGEVGV